MPREVKYHTPIPANCDQLVKELEALAIPGVRTYSVFGRPGECAGVYPWDKLDPEGRPTTTEYHHIEVTEAQANQIRDAISAHKPVPPEPPAHVRTLRALRAKVKQGQVLTPMEHDQYRAAMLELVAEKGYI